MTMISLLTGLVVGAAAGCAGRWIVPAHRIVPLWVLLAVGVGAAASGSVVARLAGIDATGLSLAELLLQLGCAAVAVALVARTGERRDSERFR